MYDENEWLPFLPSRQKENLAQAIGRRLLEVERIFGVKPEQFLKNSYYKEADFFVYNSGSVQLWFEGNLTHALAMYPEQFSIALLPEILSATEFGKHYCSYRLSKIDERLAPKSLRDCLGQVCEDVRIWTFTDDFVTDEVSEAGISYLLSNGKELSYCIYLHDDLSNDYLLVDFVYPQDQVANCFSLRSQKYIEPYTSISSS